MTVTIKLDPQLEEQLRRRAQGTGRTTSDVVRAALQAYLAQPEGAPARSAFDLGADLFGRHAGPPDLANRRKQAAADAWAERHARRGT
jgi:RHH-type rel operon transcriptional repressor/antitoxin RelB